eukprot:CAMPEP_0206207774 /NCGR_PEP_ID=MMETSP0166-20121206/15796_1 /ASSEMBLY_ACC=CAM_ASM_000260 /TAXON_ID=95228 /ORGANISM="Vannella robusta, Strain DIVA3 518/3/11/1/6" /LENGTH=32 /DNA_ID= /DNA_START= /DNA_END= /DNA_ORIENTATION=
MNALRMWAQLVLAKEACPAVQETDMDEQVRNG